MDSPELEYLKKMQEVQKKYFVSSQALLTDISVNVETLLAIEKTRLAQEFGVSIQEIDAQFAPIQENLRTGTMQNVRDIFAQLDEIRKKKSEE